MKDTSKILTIIICTYNRNEILRHCLNSLFDQSVNADQYEILVVNNFSDSSVSEGINNMLLNVPNASCLEVSTPGLSIARNRGAIHTLTEWVGYIDDDCTVPYDFAKKALEVIGRDQYKCFGGHIASWWLYKKPKWMSKDYGTKPILSDTEMYLKDDYDDYNWGGNIFFHRQSLLSVKGFDENIGMKRLSIGYSAENRVQIKLRKNGHAIGYVPSLFVNHLVALHKTKMLWHIKAAYAEGRDGKSSFPEQYSSASLFKDLVRIPLTKAKSFYRLVFEPNYYWQNLILDIFKNISRLLGKVLAR